MVTINKATAPCTRSRSYIYTWWQQQLHIAVIFTHSDSNIYIQHQHCIQWQQIMNRVAVTVINNGGNSGVCLCNCSKAVDRFREGIFNCTVINNLHACVVSHGNYCTYIIILNTTISYNGVFMVCAVLAPTLT